MDDVVVERREPRGGVDDEDDDVGVVGRDFGLGAGLPGHVVAAQRVDVDACGIDQAEGAVTPLGERVQPVARHPRFVVDDRQPLADETIEQRALTDVRAPDDRDGCGTYLRGDFDGHEDFFAARGLRTVWRIGSCE